jgi:hypothetical protein
MDKEGLRPFLTRLYPELEFFPRTDWAYEALTRANQECMRRWQFWALILSVLILIPFLARFLIFTLHLPFDGAGLSGGLAGGIVPSIGFLAYRRSARRHLRKELVALKIPICLKCGYDLRGQTEPRCPECGTSFDPALLKSGVPDND